MAVTVIVRAVNLSKQAALCRVELSLAKVLYDLSDLDLRTHKMSERERGSALLYRI